MTRSTQLLLTTLGLALAFSSIAATWPRQTPDTNQFPVSAESQSAAAVRTAPVAAGVEPVRGDESVRPVPAVGRQEEPSLIPDELSVQAALQLSTPPPDLPLRPISANCPTPRSLMLHTHYGVERMEALADGIIAANMRTMTYREVLERLSRGECPPSNSIVVSLDDISTAWIDPIFEQMVAAFTDRGLVLVLGVIVGGPADPGAWTYLQGVHDLGIEIASHTLDHPNLPELTRIEIEEQISGSYRVICENLGACPVSLIVPYGSMDYGGRTMQSAWEYSFVVGIAGGLTIVGTPPYYVGRAGPNVHSIDLTMQVLDVAFGS